MRPDETYTEETQEVRLDSQTLNPAEQQWDPSTSYGYGSVHQFGDPQYFNPHTYPSYPSEPSLGDPFDVSNWNQEGKVPSGNALGFQTNNATQTDWGQVGLEQSPHPQAQHTPASTEPTPHYHPNPASTTPHTSHPSGMYTPSVTHHSTPLGSAEFSDINAYMTFVTGYQAPDPYPSQQLVLPPVSYPSPVDPGLTVAVDASSSGGPMSARSKFSTADYLNFPQSASTVRSHGASHHPITPHRLTPITTEHPSPLSLPDHGPPEARGTDPMAKRGGKPKSLGLKRKLPVEPRFTQSPSTLAPFKALPTSSRSQSFSEGSRAIAMTASREPPMTARSLPAHIGSPEIGSLGETSTARLQLHNLDDVQKALTSRVKSFNKDVTDIFKSVPRSILLQNLNDNQKQGEQLASLLEMVHVLQNACAKLHITDQSGSSAILGVLRQQQLASPSPSSGRMHRNSIVSTASTAHSPRQLNLTPIGPEISAIKLSHDITLWHGGSSAPPPHEHPLTALPPVAVLDPDPAGVYGAHAPPDTTSFAPPPPHRPNPPPVSSAPPAPVPNLLFGAWHQSEIDRLCHVWLISKRAYLTELGVDFTDWCGTIPEKMLTCRILMASPAHHYMVSLNEIARARPGYVPPPPEAYYSPPTNPLPLAIGQATGAYVGDDPNSIGYTAQPQADVQSNVRPNPSIPVEDHDIVIGQEAQISKKDRVGRLKGTPGYAEARAKLVAEQAEQRKSAAERAGKDYPPLPAQPVKVESSTEPATKEFSTEEDYRRQAEEQRVLEFAEALSRAPPGEDPRLRLFPAEGEMALQANYGGTYSKVQKKYRVDEGIDWTYVGDQMQISRSKNQIMFRAVEWGLKGELERRRERTRL